MAELKQAEKMAKVREAIRVSLNLPEDAVKVGTDTFILKTEAGLGKVVISAVKAEDFDPEQAKADYEFDVEAKRIAAEARKAKADEKKAADIAKKAKNAKTEA